MSPRRAYRTDLSDARWALIEPILAAWRAARAEAGLGLSEPVHDLREIVNAILYVNRTGIAWEYLPHDLPPFKTVYDYYAKWEPCAVERTFGWEMRHHRLVVDYETLPERSRPMIHWAMIDNMSRRATGESTQTWHDDPPQTDEPSVT